MIILDTIDFHCSISSIREKLISLRKDVFLPNERIVFTQSREDQYPYIDAPGSRLIEIQQLVNEIDISNNFILIETINPDIGTEIDLLVKHYSADPNKFDYKIIPGHYKKVVPKYKDTSCTKLINHLYVGLDQNVNPCCIADHRFPLGNIVNSTIDDIFKNDIYQNLVNHMKDGYRVAACSSCYKREDLGLESRRSPDALDQNYHPVQFDIRINNICNFNVDYFYFSAKTGKGSAEIKNYLIKEENLPLEIFLKD